VDATEAVEPHVDTTAVAELRIHGVGGSPGPALIGSPDTRGTRVVHDDGVNIVRARIDQSDGLVEGFDWGAVNSSTAPQSLWVFLLPFTLLNAAGWMVGTGGATASAGLLPRSQTPEAKGARFCVHVLGLLLTFTWVAWLADLAVGYVGYQIVPRAIDKRRLTLSFGIHKSFDVRATAAWLSVVLVGAAIVTAAIVAGRSPESRTPPRGPGDVQQSLVADRRPLIASLWVHFTVAMAALLISSLYLHDALAATPTPARLNLDRLLVTVTVIQVLVFVLFAIIGWAVPLLQHRKGGPAIGAALLAFAISNAFLSGATLWCATQLPTTLKIKNAGEIAPGTERAFVSIFGWVLVGWIVFGLLLGAYWRFGKPVAGVRPVKARLLGAARRAERAAALVHGVHKLALVAAGIYAVLFLWLGHARVSSVGWPWHWVLRPPAESALTYRLSAWALPLFTALIVVRVRKGVAGDSSIRRFFSQAWDVLCFFPRHHHPFAVRSYAQKVLPELRAEIDQLRAERLRPDGRTGGPMLLSAHSQGTALAVAVLGGMENLDGIALVTYGSHVPTLLRHNFPTWFNETQVTALRDDLGLRWTNFYRLTDPIGGPMFPVSATADPSDVCLPDPAEASPVTDPREAPLEHDREPGTALAAHSHYLNEQAVKREVARLKAMLAS
jgi:hypothetical protein